MTNHDTETLDQLRKLGQLLIDSHRFDAANPREVRRLHRNLGYHAVQMLFPDLECVPVPGQVTYRHVFEQVLG